MLNEDAAYWLFAAACTIIAVVCVFVWAVSFVELRWHRRMVFLNNVAASLSVWISRFALVATTILFPLVLLALLHVSTLTPHEFVKEYNAVIRGK